MPTNEMSYKPDSKILIVTICSLNKEDGGKPEYNMKDSIRSKLGGWQITYLLKTREVIRNMILQNMIAYQKVPGSEHPLNKNLVRGKDFGGKRRANYLPAIERYSGRFYGALGKKGKEKLLRSRHHVLILSGLYGLVTPTEPIQLYSCPLEEDSVVQKIWQKDNGLTKVLLGYIKKEGIERIFDLTGRKDYRNLINWSTICNETGAEVLYCFSVIGAGEDALVSFGKNLKEFLLEASEEDLLAIKPETIRKRVLFRTIPEPPKGLPTKEERKIIRQAERERNQRPSYFLKDFPKALELDLLGDIRADQEPPSKYWKLSFSSEFEKNVRTYKNLGGRILKAIMKLSKNPTKPIGNTIIQLTKPYERYWRIRVGTYRLFYEPIKETKTVFLMAFGPK